MARYVRDSRATGRYLRTSPELQRVCNDAAEMIADRARAIAPVDDGEYKASIGVVESRGWDGRVAADVEANADHAAAVEFGNEHRKAQAVLAKAAESMAAG